MGFMGVEMGEGDQKVQASGYKINKSQHVMYSMMAKVSNNTILHI